MSKSLPSSDAVRSKVKPSKDPLGLTDLDRVKKLLADGVRASSLGIAILDSETRFMSVNASIARETGVGLDQHFGKTSRELVGGDLAKQIEPTYEKVFRTRKSATLLLTGHVRDTPEFGYWLDHLFPIVGRSGRVEQLGLFVVNVTAEKAAREIFDNLTINSRRQMAGASGLLAKFDESIRRYHMFLRTTFEDLAYPFAEIGRKVDRFRWSIEQVDYEISEMRELIYTVISQFSIPRC
jgi:PAS fold